MENAMKISAAPVRLPQADLPPTATLSEVLINSELASRPRHARDYARENRALGDLAQELAANPRNMLQRLTEIALDLCGADTAGVSLLEGDVFRWEGLAGVYASYRHSTMPRDASPCGVCIDQGLTQLMSMPDRHFPALCAEPRFVEALLIPFAVQGENIGTVWVVAHSDKRKFDAEDERIVRTLAHFAAAGWQQWKAREVAEVSNRRKDDFLAMLGHELRNPLSAIAAATAILEKSDGRVDLIKQAADVLGRQSRHLSRVIDDLTDLARIAQGKLTLRLHEVEVAAVIRDAVSIATSRIDRRHQRLTVEVPPEPIYLKADRARLTQVLANLLDNAAKYTPEGGDIRLTVRLSDGAMLCSIRDTGIGIPKEKLSHIFELFAQIKEPGAQTDGLGLGLALVDQIVSMHGGTIKALSDGPGKGSEFTVRLPL
jgi:signal transduction histidine kinase